MNQEVIPAILVQTYQQFVRHLRLVEPYVKTVHLDVMDGKFVDNKTFADASRVGRLKHKLRLALHMMVQEPNQYVADWAKAGAFRYIFHREAVTSDQELNELINSVRSSGMEVGVALNPETAVDSINNYLSFLDVVLVMGVRPGWGGQPFELSVLNKISYLKKIRPELLVGVDGGVNLKNADQIIAAGADFLVAGSSIYKSQDISQTIADFKKKLAI